MLPSRETIDQCSNLLIVRSGSSGMVINQYQFGHGQEPVDFVPSGMLDAAVSMRGGAAIRIQKDDPTPLNSRKGFRQPAPAFLAVLRYDFCVKRSTPQKGQVFLECRNRPAAIENRRELPE